MYSALNIELKSVVAGALNFSAEEQCIIIIT
jgi:hypothetical protein